jgi:CRISPR-associated endoribonuclease Cas6
MTFDLYPVRFQFTARDSIHFPFGKPGNILRGAFGSIFRRIACVPDCTEVRSCGLRSECAYARAFEPSATDAGPSGYSDWPRPFVFRARHLDGCTIPPGKPFHFDLHVFDLRDPAIAYFVLAFGQIARDGLGPRRGRAELTSVWQLDRSGAAIKKIFDGEAFLLSDLPEPVRLELAPSADTVNRIRVDFLSPTELKSGQQLAPKPEFPILFGRIRDRISALRALFGPGPLEIDFKGMGERASQVRMTRCETRTIQMDRTSRKTGQTHPLGGFVGFAEYEGDLTEFLPYISAAAWTGVGRQTVWGKGEVNARLDR